MLAADIRKFLRAGRATFTIQSVATGKHFTYRIVRKPGARPLYFASVLVAPDAYAYIGTSSDLDGHDLRATARSSVRESAPSFRALAWFLRELGRTADDGVPQDVIFRHEGKCGRCGRELTHPESIDIGLGPECAQRA
jgi:hypothetical protein